MRDRDIKTPDLTWIPCGPVPALGEGRAEGRVGCHGQGRVLSVAAAGRAGRSPGVRYTGSLSRVCRELRLVSHSPARPARRAGCRTGGGPSRPQGRTGLSQAQQAGQGCAGPGRAISHPPGRTRKLLGWRREEEGEQRWGPQGGASRRVHHGQWPAPSPQPSTGRRAWAQQRVRGLSTGWDSFNLGRWKRCFEVEKFQV